jgi:hypothetical protein
MDGRTSAVMTWRGDRDGPEARSIKPGQPVCGDDVADLIAARDRLDGPQAASLRLSMITKAPPN